MLNTKERFTLTAPKRGGKADYMIILERLQNGGQIPKKLYQKQNMTFQALREKGLIEAKNGDGYFITSKGLSYLAYVNSTNKPIKAILIVILNTPKGEF